MAKNSTLVTYYVVQSFTRTKRGVEIDEPMERYSEVSALAAAKRLKDTKFAVVAFSRTGSPITGDWEPAVIIAQFGDVPEDLAEMLAA